MSVVRYVAGLPSIVAALAGLGFRPCRRCLPERYREWACGPAPGRAYPWRRLPPPRVRDVCARRTSGAGDEKGS